MRRRRAGRGPGRRGAVVTVRRRGDTVEVQVTARVLTTKVLPAVPVQAQAAALEEGG